MNKFQVKSSAVWRSLKILFTAAPLIFLINIFFGFDNMLTIGELPRWQLLIHLHGGSIGWITLSAVGIGVWVLTNQRDVDEGYEKFTRGLVWAAVIIFACYVPIFGLAFSRPAGFLVTLLPIFGAGAVLTLWTSAIYALLQLRKQSVTTNVHVLAASALLVAAIGATNGMLLGMERAVGQFLPLPAGDRVGFHAGMMDTYLFLVASAIIEWFTVEDQSKKWTVWGLIQALAWIISASIVPVAFLLNMVDQLLPIFGLGLLLGLIIFLARTAWRTLGKGLGGKDHIQTWAFLGTIWLIIYLAVFIYFISVLSGGGDFSSVPPWLNTLFAHAGFVGMMTNLILGVLSARTRAKRDVIPWGEPAAIWLINLGIIAFVGLKALADIRYGAAVMGIGILLGIFTMFMRLQASE